MTPGRLNPAGAHSNAEGTGKTNFFPVPSAFNLAPRGTPQQVNLKLEAAL